MEEDVHELPACEDERRTNTQEAVRAAQVQPSHALPVRQTVQAHPHASSFIPLSALPARQLPSFPLSTGTINVSPATAAKEELSPSAKRAKYGYSATGMATTAATDECPSSSSFSQSSSPESVQPAASAVMIVAPSASGAPTGVLALAASPATSHSPSHSVVPTASTAGYITTSEHRLQGYADVHPSLTVTRKGKFVSPVWKPQEMLTLAKAWRLQYCGSFAEAS
ncbi:hypothetical protein L7F22_004671 [Adiantum nelumboides]|nr:hypothetical protein [Adiantum nelumboides]